MGRGIAERGRQVIRMTRRQGFTLVELLVVIAIIAMLVLLLLPAVQAARESARRSQCMNHIRNLALGFHNHESAHGFFPSAGGPDWTYHMTYVKGIPAVAPDQHGGWGFQILPFVEMNEVWVGPQGATNMEKSINAISTPLPFMFCPSRREPEVVVAGDWLQNPGNSGKSFGHAKNDYAASSHDSTERFPRGIGMVAQMQPVYVKQVSDGLSKTLLLGEKQMNVQLLGQMQANDNEGYTCGWNHDTMRFTSRKPRPDFRHSANPGDDLFGSSHPSGFVAALGDSSIHFLSYEMEQEVFRRLGHRRDGLPVDVTQ